MKPIHWILAGVGVGAAIIFFVLFEPSEQYEGENDGLENVAIQAKTWGTKKRFGAGANRIVGRVKEGIGRISGDEDLASSGALDQAIGAVKDTAGRVGQAVGETIHDLES